MSSFKEEVDNTFDWMFWKAKAPGDIISSVLRLIVWMWIIEGFFKFLVPFLKGLRG